MKICLNVKPQKAIIKCKAGLELLQRKQLNLIGNPSVGNVDLDSE